MTPRDLLARLAAEGTTVQLKLRLEGAPPSPETFELVKQHRGSLLVHLARELISTSDDSGLSSLILYGDLLHSLMVWASQWSELRLEYPGGLVLNAKPEHIIDAYEHQPWGVVYDQTKAVLVIWGYVPNAALIGKRDLKTEVLLAPE